MKKIHTPDSQNVAIVSFMGTLALLFLFLITPALLKAAPPASFQTSQIIGSGLINPTGFDIAPDGRIFILEQSGKVLIYKNGQLLPQPFTILPTSQAGGDLGLLGIAFDPDFYINHYVYFYYTSTASLNSVARFDASADTATGNPLILYESTEGAQQFHAGGTIAFGPDKKLYLSVGDNGYPPNAQNLGNSAGKILRLNKDGGIPQDNPFVGQAGKLPEIWAYGLRNPFRFQFDAPSGKLYVGDVGEQQWEEINVITKGANYGWPVCEGTCGAAGMTNPLHAYSHNGGSSSITGGFVYRGSAFPASYQGSYFFADYAKSFIKTLSLDSSGNFISVDNFDLAAGTTVDMKQAPDGSFYYLNIFPGRLYRVSYATSNNIPVAISSANVTQGSNPLTVNFSSTGSFDPDGTPITYLWNFGDGTTSTSTNPSKVYNNPGAYTVQLTVFDAASQSQAIPLVIQSGTPPSLQIISPLSGASYKAGDTITYSAAGTTGSDQALPDSAYSVSVLFHHATHIHPFLGPISGQKTGQFTIPTTGENSTDTSYEIIVTATDTNGLQTKKSVTIFPSIVNLTFTTNPGGLGVFVDSQPLPTPATIPSVAGFKREVSVPAMQQVGSTYYQFDSWSDGGSQKHFLTTPNTNSTFTATLKPTPPFTANYFNNITLSGSPVLTRSEGLVNYDFGGGSPHPSVNIDNFSARWTKQHSFGVGTYKFETLSDDGVRLFIDGVLVIDKWQDQGPSPYSALVNLTTGDHEVKLEYYESGGGAVAKLAWDVVSSSPPPPPPPPPAGQSVTSFSLINANTDQVIVGYDSIVPNSTINLASLPTRNLNVRANTSPATVGSLRFGYDGNPNFQTEINTPYALASDNNGDYFAWTPTVGTHTIMATPYTGQGASGTAGTPLTIQITITDQAAPPPPPPAGQFITSFSLINADTDQVIATFDPINPGSTINLALLPTRNLNIRANTNPTTVGSVRFGLDANANYQTENNMPYAMASDNAGNYFAWTPSLGTHTVTATPYTAQSGTGTAGSPLSLTFTIIDQAAPPPPPPAGPFITSFSLINADTDLVVAAFDPIVSGSVISLGLLPTSNLNIRANANPQIVGSVKFGLDSNANFRTENVAPYALVGDSNGNYDPWTPGPGLHTVTATPYTGQNGTGTLGTELTITFTISD